MLATTIRQKKEKPSKLERKNSLFADYMILHIGNPKDSTKDLKTINSKVIGYKINVQKFFVFYTTNETSERKMKKTIQFRIA